VAQQQVLVSCRLVNAYPKPLRDLAATATPVLLYATVEFRDVSERDPLVTHVEESVLTYDLVGKTYTVTRSRGSEPLHIAGIDSAMAAATDFRDVPWCRLHRSPPTIPTSWWVYAVLGKTRVEALGDKEVDLMYYWITSDP